MALQHHGLHNLFSCNPVAEAAEVLAVILIAVVRRGIVRAGVGSRMTTANEDDTDAIRAT